MAAAIGDSTGVSDSVPTAEQRRGMRCAIAAQCFGALSFTVFNNGVLLTCLSHLGFDDGAIPVLLALPHLVGILATIPFAYLADSVGKKRVGIAGQVVCISGFAGLLLALWLPSAWRDVVVWLSVVAVSLGTAAFASSWFALLSPVVPTGSRGRFFGKLRILWQAVCLVVFLCVGVVLRTTEPQIGYTIALGVVFLGLLFRLPFYNGIPELEACGDSRRPRFGEALVEAIRLPGYLPFCAYFFLMMLVVGAVPTLFGLLQVRGLGFENSTVVWIGNAGIAGGMLGLWVGGGVVDRLGSRFVFVVGHVAYALLLLSILLRNSVGIPVEVYFGAIVFLFGGVAGAVGIAQSTELLGLISIPRKSLATSLATSLTGAGAGIGSLMLSGCLSLGVLNEQWSYWGHAMTSYDAVVLGASVWVLVLLVTLGLIPSVLTPPKAQWLPRGM